VVAEGKRRVKDDRKQNTVVPLEHLKKPAVPTVPHTEKKENE
jgi:hypothetical protein